ncbi:MAG TPA: serine hydrolase domain-containing protein [Pirellulales bacterium]|nr:serine hydrolase domain-containing protein [Pirellulales bacterium]
MSRLPPHPPNRLTTRPAAVVVLTAFGYLITGQLAASAGAKLPRAEPAAVDMQAERLAAINDAVGEALAARQMPGCVVLIARRGKVVVLEAYGNRALEPVATPMTVETVFDLASLTKPIATATSVMLLAEKGRLDLDDPVAKHLPEFAAQGKEAITVRQLLTHQGGLIADNDLADFADGRTLAIERLLAITPRSPPGQSFIYSDVGFMVLGELVERLAGEGLDQFASKHIFHPLGLADTRFLPDEPLRLRAAPTERRDGRWMQGEVHDPRAYALGGVAGHAGMFSTAEDLAVYAQMLLNQGSWSGERVLRPETVAEMTRPQPTPGGLRALGWDVRTGYSSNRGEGFSERACGHGGFTGTSLWIDPVLELTVIFLSNRLHPGGKGSVNRLAGQIGTIAAQAIVQGKTESETAPKRSSP